MSGTRVLDVRDFFSRSAVWPSLQVINPRKWLDQFGEGDRAVGVALLDSFVFFNDRATIKLFLSAVHQISTSMNSPWGAALKGEEDWAEYLGQVRVARVMGDSSSDGDSSMHFIRALKRRKIVPDGNFLGLDQVVRTEVSGKRRPIIFVDDFVGTGDQFLEMWHREVEIASGVSVSLAELSADGPINARYVVAVATHSGAVRIERECAGVKVEAAHMIQSSDSVIDLSREMYGGVSVATIRETVSRIHQESGLVNTVDCGPFGYQDLGLSLAFEHGLPDGTLPIFWAESELWSPLVKDGR